MMLETVAPISDNPIIVLSQYQDDLPGLTGAR